MLDLREPQTLKLQSSYPIVETFHSLQGEGTWSGVNAFFIRLAGCDVGCPWCDTKESWPINKHPLWTLDRIVQDTLNANPAIVIITGGEPLIHNLQPLTHALKNAHLSIHLETSGAYPLTGHFDWITLSPKPFKPPQPSIYLQANELKVIIATQDDLQWASLQAEKIPPHIPKFLQPEWNTFNSRKLVFDYILQHPQWRMSLQTHKFLGVK